MAIFLSLSCKNQSCQSLHVIEKSAGGGGLEHAETRTLLMDQHNFCSKFASSYEMSLAFTLYWRIVSKVEIEYLIMKFKICTNKPMRQSSSINVRVLSGAL